MERFNDKFIPVTESGCWIWMASLNPKGYGYFGYKGKVLLAHRASYLLHCGEIPEGLLVCHECDVPACVNPNHLFLGTAKDNTQDMINKGRFKLGVRHQGEAHYQSKLTEKQALDILNSSKTYRVLAKEFNVSVTLIGKIKRREAWQHL